MAISTKFQAQVRAFLRDRVIDAAETKTLLSIAKKDIEAAKQPLDLAKAYQTDGFDRLPYAADAAQAKDDVDWYLQEGVAAVPVTRAAAALKRLIADNPLAQSMFDVNAIQCVRDGEFVVAVKYRTAGMGSPEMNRALGEALSNILRANGHRATVTISAP